MTDSSDIDHLDIIQDFARQKGKEHAIQFMAEMGEFCRQRLIHSDPFAEGVSEGIVQEFTRSFCEIFQRAPRQQVPLKSTNRQKRRWSTIFHSTKQSDRDVDLRKGSGLTGSRPDLTEGEKVAKKIVLIDSMKVLSFNDASKEKWQPARVSLVVDHEIRKIEIFIPPKSSHPKTCIFCFLLEDIRNTTPLELPDSDCGFVIKPTTAPGHVLIAEDKQTRDLWVAELTRAVVLAKYVPPSGDKLATSGRVRPAGRVLTQSSPNISPAISVENVSQGEELLLRDRSFSAGGDLLSQMLKSRKSASRSTDHVSSEGLLSVPNETLATMHRSNSIHASSTDSIVSSNGGSKSRKYSLPSPSCSAKQKAASLSPKFQSMEEVPNNDATASVGDSCLSVPMSRLSRDLSSTEDISGTELVDIQDLIQSMNVQALVATRESQLRRNTIDTSSVPARSSGLFSSSESEVGGEGRLRTVTNPVFSPTQNASSHPMSPGFAAAENGTILDEADSDPMVQLFRAPWYHGILLRHDCSSLLQSLGPDATGRYLVRKSESVDGEYVLSFNYQGRAKHLRMSVSPNGSCRMQHLSFSSVSDMLEHFKNNSIPLESPSIQEAVLLTEYISSEDSSRVRVDYNAFQQSRSNATLRGRAQSFSNSSNFNPPSLQLRVGGRPVSRAVDNIYVRT